jgi:response regulator of citrate/malate metabolism
VTEEYGPLWQAMETQDPIGNETESLLVGLGMNTSNIVFNTIKSIKVGTVAQIALEADVSQSTVRKWAAQFVDQGSVRKTVVDGLHGDLTIYSIIPV